MTFKINLLQSVPDVSVNILKWMHSLLISNIAPFSPSQNKTKLYFLYTTQTWPSSTCVHAQVGRFTSFIADGLERFCSAWRVSLLLKVTTHAIKTMCMCRVRPKRSGANPRAYAFLFPWRSRPSQLITFMEKLGHIFAPTREPRGCFILRDNDETGPLWQRVWLRAACKPSEITQRRPDQKARADLQPIFHTRWCRMPLMMDLLAIRILFVRWSHSRKHNFLQLEVIFKLRP